MRGICARPNGVVVFVGHAAMHARWLVTETPRVYLPAHERAEEEGLRMLGLEVVSPGDDDAASFNELAPILQSLGRHFRTRTQRDDGSARARELRTTLAPVHRHRALRVRGGPAGRSTGRPVFLCELRRGGGVLNNVPPIIEFQQKKCTPRSACGWWSWATNATGRAGPRGQSTPCCQAYE